MPSDIGTLRRPDWPSKDESSIQSERPPIDLGALWSVSGPSAENQKGPPGLGPSAIQGDPLPSQKGPSVGRRDHSAAQRSVIPPVGQRPLHWPEGKPAIGQRTSAIGQRMPGEPLPSAGQRSPPNAWLVIRWSERQLFGQRDPPADQRSALPRVRGALRQRSEGSSAEGRTSPPVQEALR